MSIKFPHKFLVNENEDSDVSHHCHLCGVEQERNREHSYRFRGEESWTYYGYETDCIFIAQKARDAASSKLNKGRKSLRCFDCNGATPSYMVYDEVWKKAWPDYDNVKKGRIIKFGGTLHAHLELCFDCLEKRLGRKLDDSDFNIDLPINHGVALGMRIANGKRVGS